jgi:hypothetical protein
MTRTITIVAGLALLFAIAAGSLASAKIVIAQLTHRAAINDAADIPQTDATGGTVARDRWAAYWNRVVSAKDLDVVRPVRWCTTF